MSHCGPTGALDRPLPDDPGSVAVGVLGTGVAQIHGWICGPENTGPPLGWLVTFRRATCLPPRSAVITVGPVSRPVTSPTVRPSARRANAAETSRTPAVTWTAAVAAPSGMTISTSASPPEIMSARLDSVLICSGASPVPAGGASVC